MKSFLRAYNYTLVPVVGLIIVLFIVYYTTQFPVEKAMRIGTLYGFLVGIVFNILPALIVLVKLNSNAKRESEVDDSKTTSREKHIPTTKMPKVQASFVQELYLLMDREMAFDVSLQSILEQSLGTLLNTNKHRGLFSVRTEHQTMDFEIQPLTRHTSKVNIKAQRRNDTFDSILQYIKTKEASILTY